MIPTVFGVLFLAANKVRSRKSVIRLNSMIENQLFIKGVLHLIEYPPKLEQSFVPLLSFGPLLTLFLR